MSNSHANWLRRAAEEIAKVGHYGWGNTCEDAAEHIDALEAELAALRAQEAKYQKAIEYAEECFRDAESRANEATAELAALRADKATLTDSVAVLRELVAAVTKRAEKAEAEAARLQAAIEQAPHDKHCVYFEISPANDCDCWKRAALGER